MAAGAGRVLTGPVVLGWAEVATGAVLGGCGARVDGGAAVVEGLAGLVRTVRLSTDEEARPAREVAVVPVEAAVVGGTVVSPPSPLGALPWVLVVLRVGPVVVGEVGGAVLSGRAEVVVLPAGFLPGGSTEVVVAGRAEVTVVDELGAACGTATGTGGMVVVVVEELVTGTDVVVELVTGTVVVVLVGAALVVLVEAGAIVVVVAAVADVVVLGCSVVVVVVDALVVLVVDAAGAVVEVVAAGGTVVTALSAGVVGGLAAAAPPTRRVAPRATSPSRLAPKFRGRRPEL